MDPGRHREFLVEGGFELRQPFSSAEGLRSRDKDDLVSLFFRACDELFGGLCRADARRSNQN
jgi:hypothetical protein